MRFARSRGVSVAAACLQERGDPHWTWHLTVEQAQELAGAIVAARGYLTVTKLWDALKHVAGIDYIVQVEELIEKNVFGFSRDEIESWGENLAYNLGICDYAALMGDYHPRNRHSYITSHTGTSRACPAAAGTWF